MLGKTDELIPGSPPASAILHRPVCRCILNFAMNIRKYLGRWSANQRAPISLVKPRLFWLISRVAHILYSKAPVFGAIRGAVAIIRNDAGYVVIERNDGYGLSFPGGMSRFGEKPENTVRREVLEETGLQVTGAEFKFQFQHPVPFPTLTHVFEVRTSGELKSSWEGAVRVVTLAELKHRVMVPQTPVVEYIGANLEDTRS
jgi:8-oxo-dGTP pyrophosphatase MutT (NUDIX family)